MRNTAAGPTATVQEAAPAQQPAAEGQAGVLSVKEEGAPEAVAAEEEPKKKKRTRKTTAKGPRTTRKRKSRTKAGAKGSEDEEKSPLSLKTAPAGAEPQQTAPGGLSPLRQALAEQGETVPDQKGKPTATPTLRWIFQQFEGIDLLVVRQQGRIVLKQVLNLRPVHQQILRLLGSEVANCYSLGP